MTPILAQLENVAPQSVRDFALIVGGVAATAYYVKEIFWSKGPPQPFAVKKIQQEWDIVQAETERRLDNHDRELVAIREILRQEIPEMERRITQAGDARIRRVHRRLDPLFIGLSGVCVKMGVKMPRVVEEEE